MGDTQGLKAQAETERIRAEVAEKEKNRQLDAKIAKTEALKAQEIHDLDQQDENIDLANNYLDGAVRDTLLPLATKVGEIEPLKREIVGGRAVEKEQQSIGEHSQLDSTPETTSSPETPIEEVPEEEGFFGSIKQSLKQYNQGIEEGLKSPDKKTRYKAYGKIALQGIGLAATGFAVYKAYKGIRNRFGGLFGGKKHKEKNKDSKPRYKKTRAKVLGVLGLAALVTWKGESMKDRLGGLFSPENANKKKDQLGATLARRLGSTWTYDKKTGKMHYGGQSWTLEYLQEQNVIKPDASNKELGYDIDGSISALQKFVQNPENSKPDAQESGRFDKTQSDPEVKKHRTSYDSLSSIINTHYASKKYELGDATESYEQFEDGTISSGLLIGHLDRSNMYNTNAILKEGVIGSFVEGSKKHGERAWLFAVPQEMLVDVLKKLAVPIEVIDNIANSQSIAETNKQLNIIIENLDDKTPENVKQYRDTMIAKQSMIISYLLDVKETYRQLSGGSEDEMNIFNKPLHELITLSETDPHLQKAFSEPDIHEGLLEEYQDVESDRSRTLTKLENAETDEHRASVVESMYHEIKDVGFIGWSVAFDTLRGHLTESDAYIDMNILDQVYGETFSGWMDQINTLKQKNGKLTPEDLDNLESLINDFYDTMKAIKTQNHVMQETDENGDLYTWRHLPIIKGGKKVMQSFLIEKNENGMGVNIIPLALGTIPVIDVLTYPIRKPVGMAKGRKKLLKGKEPKIFSPTVGAIRKIGAPITGFVRKQARKRQLRYTRRLIASKDTVGAMRYLSRIYNTPEKLINGIKSRQLPLDYAARIAEHNITRKRIRFRDKTRKRSTTFTSDIKRNKLQLLREIYGATTFDKEELNVLMKYFDNPKLNKQLRHTANVEKLLPLLKKGNIQGAINTAKGLKIIDGKEAKETAESIIKTQEKSINKTMEKLSKQRDKEFSNAASKGATKKELQAITDKYAQLSDEALEGYNKTIYKQERKILQKIKGMKPAERRLLYESDDVVKRIIDNNGGLKLLTTTKRGRMFKIGTYAIMGTRQGGSALKQGKGAREATKEVADFGFSMVPIGGDLYDITMAIIGKDLNGNRMSGAERWTRAGIGVVSGVANVFTFGMGGTAIKGITKGTIKIVTKEGVEITAKQAIKHGMKRESLKKGAQIAGKQALKNGAYMIGGLTLIQGGDALMKKIRLDNKEKEQLSQAA